MFKKQESRVIGGGKLTRYFPLEEDSQQGDLRWLLSAMKNFTLLLDLCLKNFQISLFTNSKTISDSDNWPFITGITGNCYLKLGIATYNWQLSFITGNYNWHCRLLLEIPYKGCSSCFYI